jgi:type II secretion system protein J
LSRRRRGLTLIEVVVAITIGAMLLAVTTSVFRTALDGRERVRAKTGQLGALRRAFEVISRDMHSATILPEEEGVEFGVAGAAGGLGRNVLQIMGVVGEPLLQDRMASETVLIQYAIREDDRTGEPTLWRFETAFPAAETLGLPMEPPREMPLLPGAVEVSYLFFSEDQRDWLVDWDGQVGLPTAIRLDILLEHANSGDTEELQWVFALPAARAINEEAMDALNAAAESEGF